MASAAEKAKDFKGTMRQLLGYIGQHKIAVFAAVAFAVCSVIFNIVGPKVLGQVTTSCSKAWSPRSTAPATLTLTDRQDARLFALPVSGELLSAAWSRAGS